MPRKNILVPITDTGECTSYFLVEYKLSTETNWNSFTTNVDEINNYIEIPNVADASIYDIRITRYCCNGTPSQVFTGTKDTTTTSTQLAAPTGFTLNPNANVGELDANWTGSASAVEYILEIATDAAFTTDVQNGVTLDPTVTLTFTGLTSGTTYYGRVKARANGFLDSDWSNTDSGIPV